MNKFFSSLMVLMITTCMLSAQSGPHGAMMQERFESQRVAFITEKLQLTPDEAAKFWPLYNEYRDKQQDLRSATMPGRKGMDITDAEAEEMIEQHFATEESLLLLKREYYGKLKSAIPSRKVARLVAVEMEFNRIVLERIRERMRDRN